MISKALSGFEGPQVPRADICGRRVRQIEVVGADDGEGTPVPIPNTAVKLTGADNTWLEAARDDK